MQYDLLIERTLRDALRANSPPAKNLPDNQAVQSLRAIVRTPQLREVLGRGNDTALSGPPIVPVDSATERERLIAANQAFAAALKQALRSGAETSGGVLATVSPKRGKNGILAL